MGWLHDWHTERRARREQEAYWRARVARSEAERRAYLPPISGPESLRCPRCKGHGGWPHPVCPRMAFCPVCDGRGVLLAPLVSDTVLPTGIDGDSILPAKGR